MRVPPPPTVDALRISAVVPVLDEARVLEGRLRALAAEVDELIVVDGGSRDGSPEIARACGARVLAFPPGRGGQQAAGARAARGELLWFVHADAAIPAGSGQALRTAAGTRPWGCFEVDLQSADPRLRFTAWWMNRRAALTGSCTGDMALWLRRDFYEALGGFATLPAFEDLDLSDRARRRSPPALLRPAIGVDPRRWEGRGVNRTILRLWALRAAWRLGLPPARLATLYRDRVR